MSTEKLVSEFRNPPSSFRPQPLWVWNGIVTRDWISRSLEDLAGAGFGGVFVHPRPGLVTEYLSAEWFALWRFAAGEAKRLGLECHIYDENSFPAGFAGGHVPARNPMTVAMSLRGRLHTSLPVRTEGTMAAFRVAADGSLAGIAAGEIEKAIRDDGATVMTMDLSARAGDMWQGGFAYVDLTLPETTRTFLETTHEAYLRECGEFFGDVCKYAFSDEPMLQGHGGLPFSRYLQAEFRRRHGYDIESRLADLPAPTDAGREVRFDFQCTAQHLFETHFAARMAEWCGAHGLAFTGHFMEHEWPDPSSHPSAMSLLRHMPVPGNDLLGFQFDPTKDPAHNGLWQLNLAELRSVAAQTGAERVLCETCGGGGYNYTLRDFKACEDFAMVGGVTLVNPHLVHQTLTGARRYDWGQTISPHAPWFEAYRGHADHVARVQTALLAGKHASRVLVMMPTTSAWLEFVPPSLRTPGYVDKLAEIRASQVSLVRLLASAGVDFDLGDELILRDLGQLAGQRLGVGQALYDVVVIPEAFANVLPTTWDLLVQFVDSGGRLLALREDVEFMDGRRTDPATTRWTDLGETARRVTRDSLVREIDALCPRRVRAEGAEALPPGVMHLAKVTPAGETVHFFANPYDTPAECVVLMDGEALAGLDTGTGHVAACDFERRGGAVRTLLTLPARGHALFLAGRAASLPATAKRRTPVIADVAARDLGVRRSAENLLVLDFCDVTSAGGASAVGVPCIRAEQLIWRDHGKERNPWRWAVQYRRTYLDAVFPKPSGFELTYRFEVAEGVDTRGFRLAVERAHLYELSLNGTRVDPNTADRYFDEEMSAMAIGHAVQFGENVLKLRATRMHALCEVTPPYVLGEFGLRSAKRGFTICPPAALHRGPLIGQGLQFYNRGVEYSFEFKLATSARRLVVSTGQWSGSVLGVRIGDTSGWATMSRDEVVLDGLFQAGKHVLLLDLRGPFKNQMGPWHNDQGLPIPWAWEVVPTLPPAGEKYKLTDWGLAPGTAAMPRLRAES